MNMFNLILFSPFQIVHVESEWYWGQFFSNIQNTDYKEKFMSQLSEYIGKIRGSIPPTWQHGEVHEPAFRVYR